MDKETRLKRYSELPIELQTLYSSDKTMLLNMAICQKNSIVNIREYVETIGSVVLGFYHTKDLPALLQQEVGVSAYVAQMIVSDLAEFLAPVLEREADEADPKKASLKALQQKFGRPTPPSLAAKQIDTSKATSASVAQYIDVPTVPVNSFEELTNKPTLTRPPNTNANDLHNVTPMRTMATDLTRIHGYSAFRQVETPSDTPLIPNASQEDLLTPRPRLTNIPRIDN